MNWEQYLDNYDLFFENDPDLIEISTNPEKINELVTTFNDIVNCAANMGNYAKLSICNEIIWEFIKLSIQVNNIKAIDYLIDNYDGPFDTYFGCLLKIKDIDQVKYIIHRYLNKLILNVSRTSYLCNLKEDLSSKSSITDYFNFLFKYIDKDDIIAINSKIANELLCRSNYCDFIPLILAEPGYQNYYFHYIPKDIRNMIVSYL